MQLGFAVKKTSLHRRSNADSFLGPLSFSQKGGLNGPRYIPIADIIKKRTSLWVCGICSETTVLFHVLSSNSKARKWRLKGRQMIVGF